jgi:exopolysaccharide production protein ExoY
MRMDMQYIRQYSFWQDLRLLMATVPAVLMRRGAY